MVEGKPADQPLWPGTWADNAADMLKADLSIAGVEYKTDEGYFDFHATRHGAITTGGRVMDLHHLMKFARHGKVEMTLKHLHVGAKEL